MGESIEQLRTRIADRDRTLLATLNERLELVAELSREKQRLGLPFLDPDQERRVADALVAANAGPCTEEGVRELVDAVLALTKRELERGA